jgi:23S rRNA pseudouridine2605 synthase
MAWYLHERMVLLHDPALEIDPMNHKNTTTRVGLARALSKLGYCSRSQAAKLIREGRVLLNGSAPRDPETPVRLGADRIEVDNAPVTREAKLYLLLNKPRGAVTTASDEKGRETVYAFLPPDLPWIAPVGRLDKASEGLLLMTNDSGWAARIADPETHLEKTYHVQIQGTFGEDLADSMMRGHLTKDGEVLRAKSVQILRQGKRNTWLTIVLDEGKNRHIRRMLEIAGVDVLRLVRVAIGPLALAETQKGCCRFLSAEEKNALDVALRRAGGSRRTPSYGAKS